MAVAPRSGIAKTTIYRQWRSSDELLVDAFESDKCDVVFPNTGDLRADLTTGLLALADTLGGIDGGRPLPATLEAAERDQDFAQLSEAFIDAGRKPLRARLTQAVRADSNIETLMAMLAGPLFFRRLLTHQGFARAFVQGMTQNVIKWSAG